MSLEHKIEPMVLTQRVITLMTTRIQANLRTARDLLLAGSDVEDPAATLMLVKSALNRDSRISLSDLSKLIKHLRRLADSGNAPALFLRALEIELEGKLKVALKMYLQSIQVANENGIEAELVDIRLADAWRAISRVRKRLGDNQGTKAALERAAFECDDALAYLHLANDFSDPTSPEHELYLLKAASSGILEAIEKLGSYYKENLQNKLKDLLSESQIEWVEKSEAFEWLSLGASAGIPSSQIHFAALLKIIHRPNEALKWLAEASKSPQHATIASRLKRMWNS